MKRSVIFLLLVVSSLALTPVHAQSLGPSMPAAPADGSYVLDELDWLTPDQESGINSILRGLDRDGVAEIAVVTLDDCGPDKQGFRKELFDRWGIGHRDDNDGLLILVCWYNGDASRRSVEQLYGRGLNGILNSTTTDRIAQEDFVPAFRGGQPGNGLVQMVRDYDVLLRTRGGSGDFLTSVAAFFKSLDDGIQVGLVALIIFGGMFLMDRFFPGLSSSRREWFPHDSGRDSDGFGGGSSDGGGGSSTGF